MTTNNNPIPNACYFGLGLLAGGAAALLLAPWSGREMRGKLRQGANDATAKVNEGVGYLKRRSGELTSKAEKLMDAGKQRLMQEGHRIEAAIEGGKEGYFRESPVEN